ncbi:MAG: hypothetical protein MJ237_04555 [bacterium]|nr:hypothetical protein [bacterium]
MVNPVQSLTNMEHALYGNQMGFYGNAPSALNNYQMPVDNTYYYQQSPLPYDYYQQSYSPTAQGYPTTQNSSQNSDTGFQGSKADWDKIGDYYLKQLSPSEGLTGAAVGGVSFAIMNNPRLVVHPFNSITSLKTTMEMFKCIKTNPELAKMWANPESNEILREAFFRMNKVDARTKSKIGMFRKRYTEAEYNTLKEIMEKALNSGNKEQIIDATVKLKAAYTNNGWFFRGWDKVKSFFTGEIKDFNPLKGKENAKKLSEFTEEVKAMGTGSFKNILKRGGLGNAAVFVLIEFIAGAKNIKTAFSKDSNTGWTQVGQTAVKGAGSAAGWAVGEAAGIWASTKLMASLGTAIAPGWGTIIGGALGMIGASIGMWLTGKATKWLVGEDVGAKVEIDNLKNTADGQAKLLQLTIDAAQKDKKLDKNTAIAMANIINQSSSYT